ncbi:MAG: 30S ribosomal protein S8 [Deltaproteobacteria bacterium DG_8]|nr:MAG: 30S ribosomal protein S8 [Deltaproteobacteria bacterium DG_8]
MITDPIADMLTRIRNANKEKFEKVDVPSSRLKVSILNLLKREGYIKDLNILNDNNKKTLRIFLRYDEQNQPFITGLKRVSRPGLRIYAGKDAIPSVMSGLGLAILSTSKGVITSREARSLNVGGEVICFIW